MFSVYYKDTSISKRVPLTKRMPTVCFSSFIHRLGLLFNSYILIEKANWRNTKLLCINHPARNVQAQWRYCDCYCLTVCSSVGCQGVVVCKTVIANPSFLIRTRIKSVHSTRHCVWASQVND